MFGLFTRSRRTRPVGSRNSAPVRRNARLSLEHLETRFCPAGGGGSDAISLNVAYGEGHNVTLSGQVTNDPNPAGLTVNLTGVVSGQAVTNSSGAYSITLTASALGNISASVVGSQGGDPVAASLSLANKQPVIMTFTASYSPGDCVTVSGTVYDEYAPELTVSFQSGLDGVGGATTTVCGNGSFSFTFIWNTNQAGSVAATVTDWWGSTSSVSYVYIS